jgi:hypothetical protein
MDVMFETTAPPDIGFWELNIHQRVEIKTSRDVARRRVSIFVGEQIANLLYGESPTLVLRGEKAFWRVPVALATASLGRIGQVGAVEVDVTTGELCLNEKVIQEIETNAQRLATGAAL